MARSTIGVADSENPHQVSEQKETAKKKYSMLASLGRYAMLGAAATAFLSAIEWIDLSFQLTPVFRSFSERLVFTSYFSLNILAGALIGLLVGGFAHGAAKLKALIQRKLAKKDEIKLIHKLIAGLTVAALAAALLNQQPQIHNYIMALLREAEKFPRLAKPILIIENLLSYFVLMGLVIACSLAWMLARASIHWPRLIKRAWQLLLLVIIGAAYYIDSRVEVQQYEYSMHLSMFLLDMTLAMTLIGSAGFASDRRERKPVLKKAVVVSALIVIAGSTAFTFARFEKNQNLRTQIFYRSTQAKQHFKLAQWALDFDRDGYSPFLGGGDMDDFNRSINPGAIEIAGDGIDNNSMGGDLTEQAISDWQNQFASLHAAPNPSPRRMNLIYFFIDTLRPDHLGAYGYRRGSSPNIDKLAARSSVFENAFTPSPYTYEAVPKFMQSTYWDAHLETWTEIMGRSGYKTIIFPRRLSMLMRHVKGMSEIVDAARKGVRQTIDAAIDVLGKTSADQPFCAYIYASDPHRPYRYHEGINFGSSLIDQYDGEVAYLDYHLGRLFDWMEKAGRLNDTMVVIMSDHGESFGERMVYKHNSQLYDEQMRVPMIFYVPGQAPRRIPDYVSTVDLGTTILNLVGIDCPKESAGVSLLPLMRGEAFAHPPVYGEHVIADQSPYVGPERAAYPETRKFMVITQDGFKLIYNRNYYNFELFNLKEDPKENRNLYDHLPEKATEMKQLLGRFADIVAVKRPWDADELKFYFGLGADDDEGQK